MRSPSLRSLCLLLSLLGTSVAAESEPPADPKTAAAIQALKDFDAALVALRPPAAYTLGQRRLAFARLTDLKEKLSFVQLPAAERTARKALALERLRGAVADAENREAAFWAAQNPDAPARPLPAATADPLRADAAALHRAFDELAPSPALVGANGQTGPERREQRPRVAAKTVASAQADARRSIDAPNAFFDNLSATGGVDPVLPGPRGAARSSLNGGLPARNPSLPPTSAPLDISDLRVGPVPAPRRETTPVLPSRAAVLLTAAAPAAHAALAAARSTPVVGPLASSAAPPKAPAALASPAAQTSPDALCRQAAGGGTIARLCGLPYPLSLLAPAASGFLDSMFSLGGLGNLVVSLLIGVLLPALTGGVGLVFTAIKALLGLTAVVAIGYLLYQIVTLLAQLFSLPKTDPRHWAAARRLGALSAQLVISVAGIIGGVALGRATGATSAIRSGLTALQAQLAASGGADAAASSGIGAQLRGLLDSESPTSREADGKPSDLKPPDPPPEEPRDPPGQRHKGQRVNQRSLPKKVNTVAEPWVPMSEHARILNMGEGVHEVGGQTFRVTAARGPNGEPQFLLTQEGPEPKVWRYGVHENSYHPVEGPGFHTLTKGGYKALGVYNQLGPESAAEILQRMKISPEDQQAALEVWKSLHKSE